MTATTAFQPMPPHELGTNSGPVPQTEKPSESNQAESRTVEAKLSFFEPPENGEQPYNWAGANADAPPNGIPRNFGTNDQIVAISDIRGRESDFNLDSNAFEAIRDVPSAMKYDDWNDDETIRRVYYPEIEKLLLEKVAGSHKITIFDHTIRKPKWNRAPVRRVHIDQTGKSAEARVRHHLGDEAEEFLRGRYRIINIWRPLNGPVQKHPLAVADSSTVRDEDLIPVEHRYPDRTGETAAVKYHQGQKWYYWRGMTNEERLLLKCFDSDEKFGPTGRVPHSAFEIEAPDGAPERESIEIRALVFG